MGNNGLIPLDTRPSNINGQILSCRFSIVICTAYSDCMGTSAKLEPRPLETTWYSIIDQYRSCQKCSDS